MERIDLTVEAAWTPKFGGTEQYAVLPAAADGPLAGRDVTLMVVCDSQAFSLKDREHAQLRWEGLGRKLGAALARLSRHLSFRDDGEFLACYGAPTMMLTAGDFEHWSLSFERASPPATSVFCDWHGDAIVDVWVAD